MRSTEQGETDAVQKFETGEPPGGDERTPVGLRFELFVDDVEASVRFYGVTLGLVPPEDWFPDDYVPLRAGAVTIGVQHYTKLPPGHHFSVSRLSGPRGVGWRSSSR